MALRNFRKVKPGTFQVVLPSGDCPGRPPSRNLMIYFEYMLAAYSTCIVVMSYFPNRGVLSGLATNWKYVKKSRKTYMVIPFDD